MKIISIKLFLWSITIAFLMLSFPIQVILFTPLPSVFPYIGLFFIILLTWIYGYKKNYKLLNAKKIDFMISVYVMLVVFHATWQSLFGFITIYAALSSIFIYAAPVLFYVYFKTYGSEREIHTVLIAIIISGLISASYYVFDSYSMLVLGEVNDFSYRMIKYTMMRSPGVEPNLARISASYRSHGLLESHSISAAWISISCFSTLALLPRDEIFKRSLTVTIYGVILCLSLNFTAIIAFFLVVVFIELQGHLLIKTVIAKSSFKKIAVISITFFVFGFVLLLNFSELIEIVKKLSILQLGTLNGENKLSIGSEETFVSRFFTSFFIFPKNMLSFPPGVLIGDGFSSWGVIKKGGDYGHAETLHQLGFPFYIASIIGLIRLIRLSLFKTRILNWETNQGARYLYFAGCIISYLLITTIHYTTWSVKSLLPIFFISLAIFSRYLPFKHKSAK